ncbi:uncharacterized protein LOC143285905 isoform X2 [Babylonia areolata]
MEVVFDTSHRPLRQAGSVGAAEQQLGRTIQSGGGVEQVRRLVEGGADISCLCDNNWTPLTLAAFHGNSQVVAYLLDCIAKASEQSRPQYRWRMTVDSVNDGGQSALYCAARRGHLDVCRQLLQAGADINAQCHHSKQTPLLGAVETQQTEVVTLLLERGADVQVTDNVGITPLYTAVEGNCLPLVRQLIQAGSEVNVGSQDHSPIFLAARKGFLSIVKELCEAGCCKDITNKYNVTALYEAASKGHNDIVQYLMEAGCDVNCCDMYSITPLQAAVMMGNLEGVRLLVDGGACVKWRNRQGRCAVEMAVIWDRPHILEFFLMRGVDVTKRPNLMFYGPAVNSPVRAAIVEESHQHPEIVLLLLRGCSRLDLRIMFTLGAFGTEPVLLELLLTSGLTQPPPLHQFFSKLSPQCRHWYLHYRRHPQPLKKLARCCVRRCLGNTILHSAPLLPLPRPLIRFLLFSDAVLHKV